MSIAYALLRQHVPNLRDICQVIEFHLYNPITTGQPLGMKALKGGASKSDSMMGRIMESVTAAQTEDNEPTEEDEPMEEDGSTDEDASTEEDESTDEDGSMEEDE